MVNNDCLNLPAWLGSHQSISAVNVEGNPLKRIRRQTVEKGTQAILLHLRDKFVAGTDDQVEQWALDQNAEPTMARNIEEVKQHETPAFQQPPPQMQNPAPVMSNAP